jgi:hypothetical protein
MASAFGVRPRLGNWSVPGRNVPVKEGALAAESKEGVAQEVSGRAASELCACPSHLQESKVAA